jgi:hypothetical protein
MPMAKVARLSGISEGRLAAIALDDWISRPELEALAKVWGATPAALIASMPDPSIVVE